MAYSPTTIERFDNAEVLGRYLLEELRQIGAELALVEQGRYLAMLGVAPPKPREGMLSVGAAGVLGVDRGLYEYRNGEWRKLDSFKLLSPTSITLNAGSGVGSVADLQTMLDGNVYHIDEVSGTPGFDIEVNFTGLVRIRGVQVRFRYLGSTTHWVRTELRNYSTAAWDSLFTTNTRDGYHTELMMLPDDTNYIDGSGNAKIRMHHVTSGNTAHDMDIDFVGVVV